MKRKIFLGVSLIIFFFVISINIAEANYTEQKVTPIIGDEVAQTPEGDREHFGDSVAINGNLAIIGAPRTTANGWNAGAAYVYRFNVTEWEQEAEFILPYEQVCNYANFGNSVDIQGDTAVVGIPNFNGDSISQRGAIKIYQYQNAESGWDEWGVIKWADDAEDEDHFGYSVGISGDYIVVGAPFDDHGVGSNKKTDAGSVYIFHKDGNTWEQVQKITANNQESGRKFGISIDIDGDTIIIGGINRAYVFRQQEKGHWTEEQKLTLSPTESNDNRYFGHSVAIQNDRAVIGAYKENVAVPHDFGPDVDQDSYTWTDAGAAYVYRFDGHVWFQEQRLINNSPYQYDHFGISVDIDNDTIVVGEAYVLVNGLVNRVGGATVFQYDGSDWIEEQILQADENTTGYHFGDAVAIDGPFVLVGAPFENINGRPQVGSAFFFMNQDGYNFPQLIEEKELTPNFKPPQKKGPEFQLQEKYKLIDDIKQWFKGF